MPSATFATCISITYFTNQGNSHILHNQNQANVTIMQRETSLTAWQSTSKIEPLIGTCSRKQNFPCDDQIRIDSIVVESKTSGLNLKKKMHKRSWGTILWDITNLQGTCSKITFTGAESKFLSLFSNIFFHNAIYIITLSVPGNKSLMEDSFPVIIAISRKKVHIHSSKQENNQPGISSGSINPQPPALNDSPKSALLLGEIGWGSLLWNKVRLPEQKDTLFEMVKLIVNYLSCLRLKTLQTIPRSVAHNCFGQIQYRS